MTSVTAPRGPVAVAAILAAFAVTVAGCGGGGEPGNPVPQGSTTPTTSGAGVPSGAGKTSTSPGSGAGASFAGTDPCSLLTSSEVSQLGLTLVGPESGGRRCEWKVRGTYSVDAGLKEGRGYGLQDIVPDKGELSDYPVGKHEGKLLKANIGPGDCMVSIGVSETARVDIIGANSGDTNAICTIVQNVAKLIEPKLPGGGN